MKRIDVSCIVLYDKNHKLLLQQRTDDDRYNPGNWALFGGGLEKNENPTDGLKREALEEIGYALEAPELAGSHAYDVGYKSGTKHVFVEQFSENKKITLGEGKGFAWFTPEQITHLNLLETDKESLEIVTAHLSKK